MKNYAKCKSSTTWVVLTIKITHSMRGIYDETWYFLCLSYRFVLPSCWHKSNADQLICLRKIKVPFRGAIYISICCLCIWVYCAFGQNSKFYTKWNEKKLCARALTQYYYGCFFRLDVWTICPMFTTFCANALTACPFTVWFHRRPFRLGGYPSQIGMKAIMRTIFRHGKCISVGSRTWVFKLNSFFFIVFFLFTL